MNLLQRTDKKDWVKVTVFVPKQIAQEILEIEKREKKLGSVENYRELIKLAHN